MFNSQNPKHGPSGNINMSSERALVCTFILTNSGRVTVIHFSFCEKKRHSKAFIFLHPFNCLPFPVS